MVSMSGSKTPPSRRELPSPFFRAASRFSGAISHFAIRFRFRLVEEVEIAAP